MLNGRTKHLEFIGKGTNAFKMAIRMNLRINCRGDFSNCQNLIIVTPVQEIYEFIIMILLYIKSFLDEMMKPLQTMNGSAYGFLCAQET